MLEARDWASRHQSSRSSKLVHGGIRYLEQLDFRLVREALIERGLLLQRIAPHLVKPVRFLYPLTQAASSSASTSAPACCSTTSSATPAAGRRACRTTATSPSARCCGRCPSLATTRFVGGLTYYDAQVDDARYVANLARTASLLRRARREPGARSRASSRSGERVVGVKAHDLRDRRALRDPRASRSSTRPASGPTTRRRMVGERGQFKVRASKGIHLVVPRDRFQSKLGLLLRTEKSVLFVIPWGRHWLIGTTDTDWNLDKAHPAATAADIDYLLEHVNAVLAVPLTRDDVEGVYAGLRPLLAGESDQTSKLSAASTSSRTPCPASSSSPAASGPPTGSWRRTRSTRPPTRSTARSPTVDHRGHRAARRRGLPGRVEQARQDRAGVRRAQGAHRAPAEPLRRA